MKTSNLGNFDRGYMIIVLVTIGFGLVVQFSASSALAAAKFNDPNFYFRGHLIRILAGCAVGLFFLLIDYRILKKYALGLVIVAALALIAALLYKRSHPNLYTARWLPLGPIRFQPSELAKFAIIVYLASFLDRHRRNLADFKNGFLPPAVVLTTMLLLIGIAPDFSTAAVIGGIGILLLLIGGMQFSHVAGLVGFYGIGSVAYVLCSPYRRSRILTYLQPGQDPHGDGYQIHQSLISLGNGGVFGRGLAGSVEKNLFLPDPHTDFIFSVVGEEFGFLGTVAILVLFILLFYKAVRIAMKAPDLFGSLLGIGLASSMFLYTLLNVGVTCGLFPVTGLPLPFFSYGGTAMLYNFAAVGMILNISRQVQSSERTIQPVVHYA